MDNFHIEGLPVAYSPGNQHPPHHPTAQRLPDAVRAARPPGSQDFSAHTSGVTSLLSLLTEAVAPPSEDACLSQACLGLVAQQVTRMPDSSFQAQDTEFSAFGLWESRMLLPVRNVCIYLPQWSRLKGSSVPLPSTGALLSKPPCDHD